ncbi:MAG: serine/threonine-protein kinase [Bryobacteraceae bacterium]
MNQVGRYQIVEELGRGAMGVVYKALDPAIGRTIAIKRIRISDLGNPDERQRVRDRLFREAQSAGVLTHPNIVTIYDVLEEEDFAYIFMEFVNGSSLEKMLRKRALPASEDLLNFFRQVSEALDYAHRKGIIHRDIKPANIIISEAAAGTERLAKIADFGVAKFVSHEMTQSGTMIGTPNYMSPEQIQGITVDGRSDQFSLGVVVYEVLSGQKPFAADSLPALFYLICKQDPKPIEQLNSTLSETTGKVLERALAKEPDRRFASCGDFIGALSMTLADFAVWTPAPRVASIVDRGMFDATSADASPSGVSEQKNGRPTPEPAGVVIAPERNAVDLPSISTRRRRGIQDEELEEPRGRSIGKKLAIILAFCFLIAAAIVFIVRWNSGPSVPVQVLDSNAGPATPPPPDATAAAKRSSSKPAPAAAPAHKPPQVKPASAAPPAPPENKTPPEPGVADVELLTEPPGAKIILDGETDAACNSPCTISLTDGRHTLTAQLNGYNSAHRIFTVPDDNSLFITLARSMGVLVVTSAPSGSVVFVDGQASGHTPVTLRLPAGSHRLLLTNGSMQHQETIEVANDGFETRSIRW